ncbi:FxSxx-COOH system tetratricopeptide repeat protein [Paractinoplanes durhamensis]|uniref:FxSxx-COOH system tetratricopeptide repeat protein n=1 Tax=Paractinoplanes durhamensis TaxID=113563 RepID=UPI0036339E95
MHEVYDGAGQPAARLIAKATVELPVHEFHSVSHETVSATLRASTVPAWEKVRAILRVLASMTPVERDFLALEQRMIELWQSARHELQEVELGAVAPTPRPIPRSSTPVTLPSQAAPPAATRPPATPGFVGRSALLESIHAALATGPDVRLVLHGPIGSGKTQTVLQYLTLSPDPDRSVWWVPSSSADAAATSLIELAAVLRIELHHRVDRTLDLVLDELESQHFPYLMIFDGLDEPEMLRLVPNGGHVIITTRDPSLGDDGSTTGIEIPDLEPGEAEELLRDHDPEVDDEQVKHTLETYGRSPLALRQTIAWSRAAGISFGPVDGVNPADLLTTTPAEGYGRTASLALLFALDRLEAASNPALLLLETLACFAPVPVSRDLLGRSATAQTDEVLAGFPRDEVTLNKAMAELRRRGLTRLTADGQRIELLPLARLVVRRALSGKERDQARARAHAVLAAANPGWPDDRPPAADTYYWEIAAHVDATGLVSATGLRAREAVYHQIRFRYLCGDYSVACDLGELAHAAWRVGNDPSQDDHLVLRTSQELANALRAAGRYERAGALTRTAMSQLRVDPAYGESHPYSVAVAASRAADLRIAGDYARAHEFDRETLAQCEENFGADHPRTTMSRHRLAISLRLTGAFRAAEQADRAALRQHRDRFGDDNWRTLLSINALAEDLNGQGRYQDVLDEVEPMLARIETRQRTRMDRGLMLARRTLALARRGTGLLPEALELLESAYVECAALFGERHEYPLALRMSHANTLHLLGRTQEAIDEVSLVLGCYRDLFGSGNPLTVAADINLANALRAKGEIMRAMRIDGASSETLIDRVGPDHPFSVAAAVNLASDYARAAHPNRLTASRRAFELAKKAHPRQDHMHVIAAKANLAVDLEGVNSAAAAAIRREVLERLESRFGPAHPAAVAVAHGERVDCILEPPPV